MSSERPAPGRLGPGAGIRARIGAWTGLAAALLPGSALAHTPLPGVEGFLTGVVHPLTTAGQLLALLALGSMLGWRWKDGFIRCWATFAIAALVGIGLGQLGVRLGDGELLLLLVSITAATLAALHPTGFLPVMAILAGAGGLLIGLVSTPEPGPLAATITTLAGSFVSANLVLLYVAGAVDLLRERFTQHWVGVGLRVAAAWIAAISMLMGSLAIAT